MQTQQIFVLLLGVAFLTGCATERAQIELKSTKSIYAVGESLEFRVAVTAIQDQISLKGGVYLLHWLTREWEDPSFGGERGKLNENARPFAKPLSKWSRLPYVVIEYETLQLYETDVYGSGYIEIKPTNCSLVILSEGQTWTGTRTVEGKMAKNFAEPGRYIFRATLNQPCSWTNRVVGVSSMPVEVEVRRAQQADLPNAVLNMEP